MGCASSAALPFLTGRNTQAVSDSANQNGKPTYELNNKLNADESFVTDKMKEVVDSSAVQGVIGGVISTKDEIVHQVQGAGEAVAHKLSSVVDGVEETVDSTMGQITSKIEDIEEKVKSEVKGVGEKISSIMGTAASEAKEKEDDIDELLAALPEAGTEIAEQSKSTAEELIEAAKEELTEDEMKNE